jgi:hypothetical protein
VLAKAKPKKEREENRARKSESAETERKKRDFALFLPPTLEALFQSPMSLDRGKSKGFE